MHHHLLFGIKLRRFCLLAFAILPGFACSAGFPISPTDVAGGPFQPNWTSLTSQYHCPEWFRDAKFGIWAIFGPQCQPEDGDWYARNMYMQGTPQNQFHINHYGPPSAYGFKDIIREWRAEKFDPNQLLEFYKKCGAKYFMAMANHHDNFDLYDSKFQPWNSVRIGPKKDLIGLWAAAARKNGLRFGVSVHASHAWTWYEPAQGADKAGAMAGVPYDGKLTKADGKGRWWEGLDPQDLYAQNHPPGRQNDWDWWNWDPAKGATLPDPAYQQKFFLRTKQLWDDYQPDLIYFDDTVLPFHGITDDIGLKLAAHFYNSSLRRYGQNEAVMNGKFLDAQQRRGLVYDIERGKTTGILPEPWQTDTCLGDWHYQRELFAKHGYKSAATVIPMLADIVSKNGNLMLSVPVRGDGSLDQDEVEILTAIGRWLKINGEAIFSSRPWKIYGEGPSTQVHEQGSFGGQRDTDAGPFAASDFRFTTSKDGRTLYAIGLGFPADGKVTIKCMRTNSTLYPERIQLLGQKGHLAYTQDGQGLHVDLPRQSPREIAFVLKIGLGK